MYLIGVTRDQTKVGAKTMKITSGRDLAQKLSNKEEILIDNVSCRLSRIVKLWIDRNEVKLIDNKLWLV